MITGKFIKQGIFTALLLAVLSMGATAQKRFNRSGGAAPAFDKGSNTLAFGLGVGIDYGYNYGLDHSANYLPAFLVTYDHGIVGNVGPGTIGIGGVFGVKTAFGNDRGYRYSWNNYLIGVRGTYHLTILKEKNNKFDPYAGITVGARIYQYHDNDNNPYNNDGGSVYPLVGPFIGAKYNFTPAFGLFAEAGYDISLLKGGFNINF